MHWNCWDSNPGPFDLEPSALTVIPPCFGALFINRAQFNLRSTKFFYRVYLYRYTYWDQTQTEKYTVIKIYLFSITFPHGDQEVVSRCTVRRIKSTVNVQGWLLNIENPVEEELVPALLQLGQLSLL